MQPYNSMLDFGTNDFSIAFWIKPNTGGYVFSRTKADTSCGIDIWLSSSTAINLTTVDASGAANYSTIQASVIPDSWNYVVGLRRNGVMYLYVNGTQYASGGTLRNVSDGSSIPMYIGVRSSFSSSATTNQLALMRISASAPSYEYIRKMYNDEKQLFQDNAKATIYGTATQVYALASDEDTKLLHVGTSSGRSVFQGLRRIDNTTIAVSASISASNGLVAEQ